MGILMKFGSFISDNKLLKTTDLMMIVKTKNHHSFVKGKGALKFCN